MNLVGKIITLLILLLSVCFLMIAVMVYSAHQNWKDIALSHKDEIERILAEKRVVLEKIQAKEQIIQTEKVARKLRITQLESQRQLAEKNYLQAVSELDQANIKSREGLDRAKAAEARLVEQDQNVKNLEDQLRTLIEDIFAQREKVVSLTNQIYELEGEKRTLEAMRMDAAAEIGLLTKVLKRNGLDKYDSTKHLEPLVDGFVIGTDDSIIGVNLGSDDGLRNGHVLDIHRDGRFIGTAVVTRVRNNRSAARIDPDLTKIAIQQGDRVTTNWVRTQK